LPVTSLQEGRVPSALAASWAVRAQGVGAAALVPSSLSLLTMTHTGEQLARALSIWSATSGSAGALGPMLGGVITSALGWRWVLLINVPIGVALWVVASATLVPPSVLDRRSLRTEPAPQRCSSSQLTTVPVIDPLAAPHRRRHDR